MTIFSLNCSKCYNVFKNQQSLKNHLEFATCQMKTIEDLEKENAELEAAMDANPEENLEGVPVTQGNVTAETIKQLSAQMLDQLKRLDQGNKEEVEEAVPGVDFAPPLPSPLRSPRREQGVFKAPLPVGRRRRRAVVGMLTSRSCSYCDLELPDFTSLALHYVRGHWEEVRRRQRGLGPRSRFHVSESLDTQEQEQAPRASSYKRGPQGPSTPSRAPLGQTTKGLQGPSKDPSWMKKLEGSSSPAHLTDTGLLTQPKPQTQEKAPSICKTCGAAFSTFAALYNHRNDKHGRTSASDSPSARREWQPAGAARPILPKPSLMAPPKARPSPLPACEVCDDEFNWPDPGHSCPRTTPSKTEVQRKQTEMAPIIKMVENRTFVGCILCKDTFMNRFKKHQKEKHGMLYSMAGCILCKDTFMNMFKKHQKEKHGIN